MGAITLANDVARFEIRPDLGAGLTAFDVLHDGAWTPVLRRVDPATDHPFALSNILLVPFSGRVSGGGFSFDGTFHPLARNMETEKYPIHGSGFSAPWRIEAQAKDGMTLSLSATGPGPFRYDAAMTYQLEGKALVMKLRVSSRAAMRLPYGAGFHPWFVRDADTRLTATASDVWLEQPDHLPAGREPVASHPDMDFNAPRPLPARWINNWFDGWNGHARIDWPRRGLAATVEASRNMDRYVVFSPAATAYFFCFEPVTHPVDAFNLPGGPERHGLVVLEPGQSLDVSMMIGVG